MDSMKCTEPINSLLIQFTISKLIWRVRLVPQIVVCQNCGEILYKGDDLKPPEEIVQRYNGRCPKCGRKLSNIPTDVEVKPAK